MRTLAFLVISPPADQYAAVMPIHLAMMQSTPLSIREEQSQSPPHASAAIHNALISALRNLPHHTIHRLCKIVDVVCIQPRHTDPSILRHVNVELLPQLLHLRLVQASKAEHANLIRDVIPRTRRAHVLELAAENLAHLHDAPAHGVEVGLPLREEILVVEDEGSDAGAVGGRVGDLGSLEDGELAANAGEGVLGVWAGGGDEVEAACSLAVEAEVFGVRLGDEELEALLDEVIDGPGVLGEGSGSEALVGAVKEGEVVFGLHHLGDFLPLAVGRVDTRRIVSTGVQQDDAAFRRVLDAADHAVEVETASFPGEVGVALHLEVDVAEDLVVVRPCRRAGEDSFCVGCRRSVEFGEEEGAEVDGTSAGDSLEGNDSLVFDC